MYAIYRKDTSTVEIIQSDDGLIWQRFEQKGDNVTMMARALNRLANDVHLPDLAETEDAEADG